MLKQKHSKMVRVNLICSLSYTNYKHVHGVHLRLVGLHNLLILNQNIYTVPSIRHFLV
ncbi:MAG: hypothetical protein ACI90V_006316 [Bacillariaceae sp.]|jgi:hypothetical protein